MSWCQNSYLEYANEENELDPFVKQVAKGNWDYDKVVTDIFPRDKNYELGRNGRPIRFKRNNFTVVAQIWMIFILHNTPPQSHTFSATLNASLLIYYILTNQEIDISRIISYNIWDIMHSYTNPPLAFLGLITGNHINYIF